MRYALRNSKWPFVFMVLFPTVVGTMFLVALAWIVHPRWFALPQIAKWPVMLIFVVVGGLVARMIAALVSVSGLQNVIEADPQERILRVVNTDIHGAYPKAIPFNDCWEMRLTRETRRDSSAVWCLSVVSTSGAEQPLARFDQLDEALDVAARLAAEIGCQWHETPFPLAAPVVQTPFLFLWAILTLYMFGATIYIGMFPPAEGVFVRIFGIVCGLIQGAIPLVLLLSSLRANGSESEFSVHVRTDPRGRVLRVCRDPGLFGWNSRDYPYDDIAEIVAETGDTAGADEPGGPAQPLDAAERPASYAVRIVARDDVARSESPWDGVGGSGPPRDDTVFRTKDPNEARLTAERLARRIGRPWRDATT